MESVKICDTKFHGRKDIYQKKDFDFLCNFSFDTFFFNFKCKHFDFIQLIMKVNVVLNFFFVHI